MITIVALVFAALVLVFFEVVLPGGLLGILALVCVLAATWLGAVEYGAFGGASVFVGSVVAVGVLVFVEFKLLANSALGKGFFLKSEVSGHSNQAPAEESIIGKMGTSLTRLNPSGKVAIDGQSYEAHSQDGYIESGQPVTVVSQDNFKLIITKS
ncbi:MAG: NfeD family protein [Verrucomicrobiota bacterium]